MVKLRWGACPIKKNWSRSPTRPAWAVLARERRATLIVFAPGLANKADALAAAFVGFDTLTVSSTPEGVRGGLVLGFDLVSGEPRLFDLGQARRQRADFRAEILQLMTVFQ